MTFGQLAQAIADASPPRPPSPAPRAPALASVHQTRDLAQITDDLIAWQATGFSTDGLALPPVFAVVRLIASTIDQLELTVDDGPAPLWLRSPRRYGSALDIGDIIQWTVTSMALRGAGYLLCTRTEGDSWRLDAVHPESVQPQVSGGGVVRLSFLLDDKEVPVVPAVRREQVPGRRYLLHIPYIVTPQQPAGVSPLTAARLSLLGYADVERQAATLLGNGTYSGGRLETDQDITVATARRYQETWVANRIDGLLPVLGAGLRYVNDLINPADAQWLESRQYNAQQVAMMYGVPPDYLGMTASGGSSSLSYANSQDNDRRFRRNCLEAFTSQIEDALTVLMPPGRGGTDEAQIVKFDYDSWEASGEDVEPSGPADAGGERGRFFNLGGDGGPLRRGSGVHGVEGIVRSERVRPGEGDGHTDAVVPPAGGTGGAHHSGDEQPGGVDRGGADPADSEGEGRDDSPSGGEPEGAFGGVRTDSHGGERRRSFPGVHLREVAGTVSNTATRLLWRDGDRHKEQGGTSNA